jgi:hypothetical protein
VRDCCCRSMKSQRYLALGSVWELPQGVHARIFSKTQSCEKAQEGKSFEVIEGSIRNW